MPPITRNSKKKKPSASDDDDGGGDDVPILSKVDIAKMLQFTGPVMRTAVVLRHIRSDGRDGKPHPILTQSSSSSFQQRDDATALLHKRDVLVEDIEEVRVDVSTSLSSSNNHSIKTILGGPWTFVGQYVSEGTMVIARRDLPDNLSDLSIPELRELCSDYDTLLKRADDLNQSELMDALLTTQLPINPHMLQPPLDKVRVRGDILLLRVVDTAEELDESGNLDGPNSNSHDQISVLSNEEFFLDYTKDEYVSFASRSDSKSRKPAAELKRSNDEADEDEENDEDEDEEDSDDEDDEDEDEDEDDQEENEDSDEDFDPSEESEEEKPAMLNLLMSEVLRTFRNKNGRGPDTRELLEIRSQVANKLGIEVATVQVLEEKSSNKRKGDSNDYDDSHHSKKHVKFSAGSTNRDDINDE